MKTEKLSIFISIVLISILALGAVSAADDDLAADYASDVSTVDEVQTIDNTITTDDMSYESSDIIVNTTGDSGDLDKAKSVQLSDESSANSFSSLNAKLTYSQAGYVSLTDNYTYDETADSEYLHGITINRDLTINGNGKVTIDGKKLTRIFNIVNGHTVVLLDLTLTRGNDAEGGAIYNDGTLILKDCKFTSNAANYGGAIYNTANGAITGDSDFTENSAVYRGGAIYSEGSVALSDSVIDSNDVTYRSENDDNGGAAIYNKGGTLTLDNVDVTNNLIDIEIRDGNAGHLVNAVLFTSGDATITNSYFANNSGSWGGAIYVTNGATLDVSGTTFEKNMATFGASIYDEGAKVIVNNCDFNENHCEGIGSAGTSSTQAAAILVMSEGASATITDSRFNKNSARTGGAVSVSKASGNVLIENCTFTENTASYEGGAIYNYAANGAELTVKDSTFTNNTAANWGDAISNDAGLKLEGNTITGDVNTAIGNWFGTIDTQVKVKILDGQEHTVTNPTIDLTATVTDDNGNKINDHAFTFTVGAEEVPATYDATEGIYKATYTFKNPGTYTVSTDSYTLEDVTDSVITFKSSLSSLKALIDENTNGTLDLTYGFLYDDELDSAIKISGIAINKDITINGNGVTLSGADVARLFEINSGFTLTLNNLIISNFVSNYGPAAYVHNGATLNSNNVNYNNNIANANGGAIYSEYGNLVIIGSTFTNNEAKGTYGTSTGVGSAIYDFAGINPGTTTYITDSTFTNNAGTGTKAGVYVDNAVITGSTFTNTVIFAMRKASISNDVFDNEGNDIHLSTNTGFVFYDGTGDLPVLSKATINYTGTSFQGLQDIITNSDYGTKTLNIGLHNDITKLADEEFANGIVIDKKVLINGLGHTLDVNGQGKAFYISEGAELSLLDMNIVGDGTSAIVNDGILKDYNPTKPITFTNAGEYPIDNDEGIITINFNTKTFTQLNSVISLISGGTINTSSTKVTKGDDEKETFADGITITQKDLSIISSNKNYQRTIDADNSGRIFNVADGASLTLKNITLQNGNAADGGAVYVNDGGKLVADSTKFLNNKATYSGGAIYATGATVSLDNCILDNNDATDHSTNNDTGGAAIYAEDSTVTISKTKVTNNGDKTLNRTKGDLINGVLNLHDSTTTITDSVFENNTGIYGGAITAETTKDEGVSKLTISGTNFTSNAAYTGGAVYVADTEFDISDSIFDANNKASGEGSTGYTAGGGALVIMSGSEGTLDNVTVKNSHASQGGAIDLENSQVTITGSTFEANSADGWAGAIFATGNSALTVEDSSFKENTAAAATIVTFGATTATIKDSNFTDNYDTYSWGVVTVYGTGDVNIEGSKFTKDVDDTYTVDVYVVDDAKVSVKDSTFDTNSYYSIVAEDGQLTLEGNDIKSDYVPIYTVAYAKIVSTVKAKILANDTYNWHMAGYEITSTLTDDEGNVIRDANFNFVITAEGMESIILPASFNGTEQVYKATFTPASTGTYLINLDYDVEEVKTSVVTFSRSLIDLKALIDANTNGTLDLDGDYAYIAEFDESIKQGIEITKDITINGNGYSICGSDLARLFKVNSNTLTLKGLTICDGYCVDGGAIYVGSDAKLLANSVTFKDNIAAEDGGAIYSDGEITIADSTFNDNEGYNGGAICSAGTSTISNSKFIGNDPEKGGAIYVEAGETLIKENTEFTSNVADFGGAIYSEAGSTVTVNNVKFTHNSATNEGGAIYALGELTVKDSLFEDNSGEAGSFNIYHGGDITLENNEFKTLTPTIAVEEDVYYYDDTVPITGKLDWGVNNYAITLPVTWTRNGETQIPNKDQENYISNVEFTGSFDHVAAGKYVVNIATFTDANGNKYLIDPTATDTFTVEKFTPMIYVTVPDTQVSDNVIASIEVDYVNGNPIVGLNLTAIVYEDGATLREVPVTTDAEGKAAADFGKLNLRNYTAFVLYKANDNYADQLNVAYGMADFRVLDIPKLTVLINNAVYGDAALVEVTLESEDGVKLDGVVEISIQGLLGTITVPVANGKGTTEIYNLDVGTYTYTASSRETGNYLNTTFGPETFRVNPKVVVIDFPIPPIEFGEDGFGWLNVFVYDPQSEDQYENEQVSTTAVLIIMDKDDNVLYRLEDVQISAEDSVVDLKASDLTIGDYKVTVVLGDNFYIRDGKDTFDFKVTPIVLDAEIAGPKEITYGEEDTHEITLGKYNYDGDEPVFVPYDYDGTATVTVWDDDVKVAEIPVTFVDGKGTISFEDVAPGLYFFEIALDSETYVLATDEDDNPLVYELAINRGDLKVDIIDEEDLSKFVFGDKVVIDLSITDATSHGVPDVTIAIDGYDITVDQAGGLYEVSLGTLEPGTYTLTATFSKEGYDDVTKDITLVVSKADITLDASIINQSIKYGQKESITVGTNNTAFSGTIKVSIINYYNGTLVKTIDVVIDPEDESAVLGYVLAYIEGLEANTYNITASFAGNEHYNAADAVIAEPFRSFEVKKAATEVMIEIPDVKAGDDIPVSILLSDEFGNYINGTVNVEVAGVHFVKDVEDGELSFTIPYDALPETFAPGIHEDAFVTVRSSHNYEASDASDKYEVFALDDTINIADPGEVSYGAETEATFNITDEEGNLIDFTDAEVSVTVDDAAATVVVKDGVGTYTIPASLATGTHTVTVVYNGGNKYKEGTKELEFTVVKATPILEVTADDDLMPRQDATIEITLTGALGEAIKGIVLVTVDGKDYVLNTNDEGKAELTISDLTADKYPIFAKFIGNDKYNEVVNDTEAIDFMMHAATFDIVIEDITYGDALLVIVDNVTDGDGNPLTGTVLGNIENATGQGAGLVVNIENGRGTRTITGLDAGNYSVSATFADEDYEFVSDTKEFTINVAKAESDLSIVYEDGTFTFTLNGVNGEKLNETLSVAIDAVPIDAAITTDNGTATYDSTFDAGTYVVSAVFEGNDNYLGSFYVLQFTVPKQTPTVTVVSEPVEWGNPATVKVTVTDADGNAINGTAVVRVSWDVDGVDEFIDIVDGAGEASFEISRLVAPGEYDVKVMFEGGRNYNDVNSTAKLTLTAPKDITVDVDVEAGDYGEVTNVTVTVTDKANAPVANAPVTVIVDNGEPKSATTDENGVVTVPLKDLAAGEHNITVKVDDGVHTPAEEEVKVTVGPASGANIQFTATDVEYGNAYPIKITVVDSDDEPLDGKAIIVLDGNAIAEVDIVDGAGEYNITGLEVGNYYLEVIFNNDNYLPSSYSDKINVTRATPTVKVEDAEAEWGSPATIKVTVYDSEGMPIEGAAVVRVSWIVDGVDQYIDITEGSGEASFEISKLVAPGEYDVKVMFEGGRNYNDVNATAKLTLAAPKDLIVDVEVEAGNYGEDTNVTVTVTDKANTPVANAPVSVIVDNGEAIPATTGEDGTVTVPLSDLIAGDHNITVKVNDGVHTPAEEEVKVTVGPASGANIQFTATDVEYGNAYPIKITVTDAEDLELDGKAIIVLDGNQIAEVDIVDGAGEYNITGLDVGSYYLEVIFDNDNYLPSSYSDKINVTRATPTVKVEDAEAEWGSPATIKVTVYDSEGMPIEGAAVVRVSWIVDGVDQYIDITEGSGEASFEISKLVAPGEYDVKVMFEGGRNYNDVNATAKLTLTAPKDLIVDVNVEAGNYGEDTNVTVTVTDKANTPVADAPVTVVVDGKEYKNVNTDENGTVTLPVSDLIAGDHNITVKVDDGEHTPTEETATATVEPASGADIQATVQPGHAGEDTIVNISAKDSEDEPLEGNAIVLVDGEPYTEVSLDENGTASVPIKDLPAGEHTVEVTLDNPNYLPSSYTTHFDVKAQDTKLVVTVDKENIVYGDGAVTATLNLSADGKPINGVVEVVLNGEVQNVTVTDGKATVKFDDLAAGNYTVVADYLGTSVYTGASDSSNFNVERKATKFNYKNMNTTAVNPNIDGRIGEYFKFQLVDEDGKALANKDVVIGFNGKTYNRTTNATGWAELQINLAIIFRYTFAINFAGDENYTSAFNVALINVTAQAPKLTTSSKTYAASAKTKSLTATFKTKSGNAVSGRQITFTVNGKSYSAKTNSKGVATVKVSISKKGTYSFTAKFAGDDTYAAASKSAKLTIK